MSDDFSNVPFDGFQENGLERRVDGLDERSDDCCHSAPIWFSRRTRDGKKEIFDPVRRRFVKETSEELVRQAYLFYLVEQLHYPKIAISVEKRVVYNSMVRRYDIVVYKPDATALVLVECKAEHVRISGDTLYQAAMYNHELQAEYVVLTNGREQVVCQRSNGSYRQTAMLPSYAQMTGV